ncbi:MAG: sigma-54-dependent Fis family transcriptional regulator [Calditrichaeota bacterium]|nr:MAG: sigma-54-dependent Fis family transcriptional regulator [Calditrichota bacterium]
MNLLVISAKEKTRRTLRNFFNNKNFEVFWTKRLGEAEVELKQRIFQVIVLDVWEFSEEISEFINRTKSLFPKVKFIHITNFQTSVEIIGLANHFHSRVLVDPFSQTELEEIFEDFLPIVLTENNEQNSEDDFDFNGIIGNSGSMKRVFSLIQKVSQNDTTVLIRGASGTGKELIASAIHKLSHRKENLFLPVNCGALTETLLESELFGHEKGSFTGAISKKIGKFEEAEDGTIFLDEIGDISAAMQVKLLRVLQQREITRVGGSGVIPVNARVIAATNKNLEKEIQEGTFREDLFYRLNVFPIRLPQLSQRKDDIPILVRHFAKRFSKGEITFSEEAIQGLQSYHFPGNIRELENIIERTLILCDGKEVKFENLPANIKSIAEAEMNSGYVSSFEKDLLLKAIEKANGNKSTAAKLLGISTKTLYSMLEKIEISMN